jgi:HEAT repeats
MPIRPSAGAEIRQLIEALGAPDELRRESAVARLRVIGRRAVDHLLARYEGASSETRTGILRVLEGIADPRALATARAALGDEAPDIAAAAAATLRALMKGTHAAAARDALDALLARAADASQPQAVRLAILEALRDAPADVRQAIGAAVAGARTSNDLPTNVDWQDMVEGRLPREPEAVKRALHAKRSSARLTELQHLIDRLRAREQQEPDPQKREEWRAVRGAAHQALAARNSRLALYDLRDSLLEPERLPVAFLAAMEEIGDDSCLEPLAAAYDASSRSGDAWWREHVARAFRAIVQRDGLTRRHAAVKRVLTRWPDAAADLLAR